MNELLGVTLTTIAAGIAALILVAAFRAVARRRWAARTVAREADQEPAHTPVEHVGATEGFGAELRALRDIAVSPELVSDIETELRWGLIWHDFEHTMQVEVDRIFAPVLAFAEVESFADLRDLLDLPAGELVAA